MTGKKRGSKELVKSEEIIRDNGSAGVTGWNDAVWLDQRRAVEPNQHADSSHCCPSCCRAV
jgi:hypothetical protein